MEDTCSPGKNTILHSFRAYSIVIPVAIIIVFLEALYIFSKTSVTLGSAKTIKGPFTIPKLPLSDKVL